MEMIWSNASKENQIFLVAHVHLTPAYQKCHILIIALKLCMFLEKAVRALFNLK